jgi:hypothetical protein
MFLVHNLAIKSLSGFKKIGPYIVHKRMYPCYSFLKLKVKLVKFVLHFTITFENDKMTYIKIVGHDDI